MEQADILAHQALGAKSVRRNDEFPTAIWEAEFLEDTSLRRLVLEYYDQEQLALRRYLTFLSVDSETAQELVQETFLKLHEHLLRGGDRANLRAWLYRVAHNLARNVQTASRARKTTPLPEVLPLELRANGSSAEEELLVNERTARFRHALQQLSPAQKESLLLRAQGLKYREIAGILNLSVSTVGENIQRGLEKLKELL